MEKTARPLPPIANAADYVDALSRPQPKDKIKHKFIEGRRMRDKFLDKVIVPGDAKEAKLPG
jgi:hypothetical protein